MTVFTNRRTIGLVLSILFILFMVAAGLNSNNSFGKLLNKGEAEQQDSGEDTYTIQNDDKDRGKGKVNKENNTEEKETSSETIDVNSNNLQNESSSEKNNLQNESGSEKFFIEYKMERERVRGQQVELLQSIADDPEVGSEVKEKAKERLISVTENMEKEMELEGLIKAKGYEDAVLFVQTDSASVILKEEKITGDDANVVADMVSKITGHDLNDIVIIPAQE